MSLKMEFVRRAQAPNANVSALCREFNVARETGHKWIKRFNQQGYDGLEERSRRPRNTPLATGEDLVVAIVESREAHPTWGPFVLATRVLSGTNALDARAVFEGLFKRNGLPKMIQCDNGAPSVSVRARAGLSALSAWWVSPGIEVIRSRPGCPQDNGAHERMHSDIAKEIQVVPCGARDSQQRACDKWRHEFNHVRPHEALKDKTPVEVYKASERRMRARIATYPTDWLVRKVDISGHIRIASEYCFLSR